MNSNLKTQIFNSGAFSSWGLGEGLTSISFSIQLLHIKRNTYEYSGEPYF